MLSQYEFTWCWCTIFQCCDKMKMISSNKEKLHILSARTLLGKTIQTQDTPYPIAHEWTSTSNACIWWWSPIYKIVLLVTHLLHGGHLIHKRAINLIMRKLLFTNTRLLCLCLQSTHFEIHKNEANEHNTTRQQKHIKINQILLFYYLYLIVSASLRWPDFHTNLVYEENVILFI